MSWIRIHIQKVFDLWIMDPDGVVWWKKTRGRKSRDKVPLKRLRHVIKQPRYGPIKDIWVDHVSAFDM
jgi:hypothetical protein